MKLEASDTGTIQRSDYRPAPFSIDEVDLTFELDPLRTLVAARFRYQSETDTIGPLRLDGVGCELTALRVNGEDLSPAEYDIDEYSLRVFSPGREGILEIETAVTPGGTGDEGLLFIDGTFITHCEPEGLRKITYCLDRPDVLVKYRCTVIARRETAPVLLSNGELIDSGDLPDGRHFATWFDPYPKATYLFALVAGDLACRRETVASPSGESFEIAVYGRPEYLDRCATAISALRCASEWDERIYGCRYDLSVLNVAIVRNYPGGAMENKGLNLYGTDYFLASEEVSTDEDMLRIEATVAHEYFHNWSGNRVGVRNWFELCLKEGLTIRRQQQFMVDRHGQIERVDQVLRLRQSQQPEDDSNGAHAVRPASYKTPNNLYTATVYQKGAELLRMVEVIVGRDVFVSAVAHFFAEFDGTTASVDDLIATVERVADIDLGRFKRWFTAVGTLELEVSTAWDASSGDYSLTIAQKGRAADPPLSVPVQVGLVGTSGDALTVQFESQIGQEHRLLLTERSQTFVFSGVEVPPIPSLLRGYSAPARVSIDLDPRQLALLVRRDQDACVRWDSMQQLAIRLILEPDDAATLEIWCDLVEELLLGGGDPGIAGRLLELPSERFLMAKAERHGIDALLAGRNALAEATEHAVGVTFRRFYEILEQAALSEMSARRLRNVCLWYIHRHPTTDDIAATKRQFQATAFDNRWAAARLLVDRGGRDRDAVLDETYSQWQSSPEQLDRWFSLHGGSRAPDAARLIRKCIRHVDFSLSDTARIKALVDPFTQNIAALHERSGSGYDAFFDLVSTLDTVNPRFAARMLRAFGDWQRLDRARQEIIALHMTQLLDCPNVSRDVSEIVEQVLSKRSGAAAALESA